MRLPLATAALAALLLSGCGAEPQAEAAIRPAAITADAVGQYCGMNLSDHPGPKGQVHVRGRSRPVWLSSVRDTFAFLMLPEEPKTIAAAFVSDMGRATAPDAADPDAWVEARQAWYVTGSSAPAAMTGAELYPFAEEEAARRFAQEHGGTVRRFADITPAEILETDVPGADAADAPAEARPHAHGGGGHGQH